MTIHKKGSAVKARNKEDGKSVTEIAVATTSADSSMDVKRKSSSAASVETTEVVSSSSVVQEARNVAKSESKSNVVEVTSASREVIMDSKGNVIRVIEHAPKTVKQVASSTKAGKSSQDFIAGEQTQSVKQGKKIVCDSKDVGRASTVQVLQGEAIDRSSQSMQQQNRSSSKSESVQKSTSSSTVHESFSSAQDRRSQSSSVVVSSDPIVQTSSRSAESKQSNKVTSQGQTRDGQTVTSTTRIRESDQKVDDNGRKTSSKSQSVDSETVVVPTRTDHVRTEQSDIVDATTLQESSKRSLEQSSRSSNVVMQKSTVDDAERKNVSTSERSSGSEVLVRNTKPGQSTWDGKFIYEKPAPTKQRNASDSKTFRHSGQDSPSDGKGPVDRKARVSNVHDKQVTSSSEITQESSSTSSVIHAGSTYVDERQSTSSSSTVIRDGEIVDRGVSSGTVIHDSSSSRSKDTVGLASDRKSIEQHSLNIVQQEKDSKGPIRHSRPGDSTWDGKFVIEKPTETTKRQDVSDATVFQHPDNVVESTHRVDSKETSLDGSYERESSKTLRTAKGATDSSKFISQERTDVSRESRVHVDDDKTPRYRRPGSPERRNRRTEDTSWNGHFVYEKPREDTTKRTNDATVVRTTKKRNDSVEVQDVTEELNVSNISELVSSSYIVEHSSAGDVKNSIEKVTSVSDTILEEDASSSKKPEFRRPASPGKTPRDATSRSNRPGESTWDGRFVYEKSPMTDRRRQPQDSVTRTIGKKTGSIDIHDVTEDNSINEADVVTTSYVVEHSLSQQSFSDVKDLSISSVTSEMIVVDGQPRKSIDDGPSGPQSRHPLTGPGDGPQGRPGSPDKTPKKRPIDKSPADGKSTKALVDRTTTTTKKKNVSDTTLDLRDAVEEMSNKSEVVSSSLIVEQSLTHESYSDSSNLDFSTASTETVIIRDGQPISMKQITERTTADLVSPDSPDKKGSHPEDRNVRPTKPGSSTWNGAFVYEKPDEPKRPGDKKRPSDDKGRPVDIKKIPVNVVGRPEDREPTDVTVHKSSIDIADISKSSVMSTSEHVSSSTVERSLVTDSKIFDSSNVSKTTVIDGKSEKIIDGSSRPIPSKPERQIDDKRSPEGRPRSPDKSPSDKSVRPSKPGSSTWDGSFVYEKPKDLKKPTDVGRGKPADEKKRPVDDKHRPGDVVKRPAVEPIDSVVSRTSKYDIVDVTDVTDVRHTSEEIIQQSSYVIDHSSSFTSVKNIHDVTEEHVISDYTKDSRHDVSDVTKSTTEFIDKEQQVTSMVARDVIVDDTRFDKTTKSVAKSPEDFPRKSSPERPGYPRGIPGLREEEKPKQIPAAGKPSRPPQREDTPQHPEDNQKSRRPSSPEKPRDYVSSVGRPAAGKPSRPAEKPSTGKPTGPEQKPAHGKLNRIEEKPKRGDQTPDSLDGEDIRPGKVPLPSDILSKIPLKEQCICELCTCGRHRCPHNLPQDHLEFPHEPVYAVTSYREEYDEKHVDRQVKYHHEDHLHMQGEFTGERRSDYVATRGDRAPVKKPKDNLKPEGNFESVTTTELVFTGVPGERPSPVRRNTYTKVEGEFIDETTNRSEYIDHRSVQRAEIIKRTDNLIVGEGEFTGTSHVKEDFHTYDIVDREPYRRDTQTKEEIDRYYGRTDIVENITTNHEQYRNFDQTDYKSTIVVRRDDNLKPEGTFEGTPKSREDYVPMITERPEQHRPKDNLRPEGPFEGRPKDDFVPKKGERPEVKRPQDNLKPEGPFEGRPKDDYLPKRGERPEVRKPKDNLRPEGDFEDRPKDTYTPGERRHLIKQPDNLYPEGEFERPQPQAHGPGERAPIVRHPDNLFPKGDFPDRERRPFQPAEKRAPIKHDDNLRPEGDFEGRPKNDFGPKHSERPEMKRPEDNLKPEGTFEGRPKDDYKPTRGERADVKKPKDNLRPEGPFEGRPKDDYSPKRGERPDVKKPQDNLKPEGTFEGRPKDDFSPKTAERPEARRPKDNLQPEGEFEERPKDKYTPGERRKPIRHPDNLYPEGEFERPEAEPFGPGERAPIVRHPDNLFPKGDFPDRERLPFQPAERRTPIKHDDNLRPEGDFVRPQKTPFGPAEKRTPIKHPDNLKPEGEFERPEYEKFRPAERPDVKRPQDNLRPEGDFVGRPKEEAPKRGERADIKKPKDNLKPEGEFERPEKAPVGPAERRTPIKHADNLKPEGEFDRPDHEKYRPAERPEVKKPKDNLRPEGDFERPQPEKYGPAEKRTPIKHADNLKPEGEFVGKPKDDFKPTRGERADVKRPEDNLKPEGTFEGRPKDDFKPVRADRVDVVKHTDNLRMEGDIETYRSRDDYSQFILRERAEITKHEDNLRMEGKFTDLRSRDDFKVVTGERVDIVRHADNLKSEGLFEGRPKDDYSPKRAERPEIRKPEDNLKPEGEFERPEKKPVGPAERRSPIKHDDNLKPEGEFIGRPKEQAPKKGERADVKKPKDNLRPEGDFDRPEKKPVGPAERRTPIKHADNLKPEGDFLGKPKEEAPIKGERAVVKKPKDNLHPEGDFERPETSPVGPAERRKPIRHEDNLHPEGEFIGRPKDDFTPKLSERPVQKKPKDNLKPEGEFVGKPKDDYKPTRGERSDIVVHKDNLRMEGEIDVHRSRDDYAATRIERVDVIRREDNLKIEGEFVDIRRRDDYNVTRGERTEIIRHEDNLHPEGDFDRPEKSPVGPAERRSPIKHPDNLKPEGEFTRRPKEQTPIKGDRASVKKPKDNLRPEGDFERPTPTKVGPGERRTPIRHPDNLKIEGDFDKYEPKVYTPGERSTPKKPQDNLKPEGDFERRSPTKVGPSEKRTPIRHEDNLHPEGDFYMVPKDDFTPKKGERALVKKPKDNLKPEGDMEVTPTSRDDYKHVNGERVEVRRHEDHLRMEGEIDVHRSRDDYKKITKVERVNIKKHEDNLRIEGEFIDVRRRDDYTQVIAERTPIKKHPDNLRPEGDFDRPQKSPLGPGERRTPIRHPDNLKPEGDFVGRPRDDFAPKRTEKVEVVRREDNLRMTGDFQDSTSQKSTYTVVRGERAEIKRHEDNLKVNTGTMETKTTSKDTYTPTKKDIVPAGKPVNSRRHMESSISLGDDTSVMTTTNQRNYNTYTKRAGKEVAAKINDVETDTRRTVATESKTLTDGSVMTTTKSTVAAHIDQRAVGQTSHQQYTHQSTVSDRRAGHVPDSPVTPGPGPDTTTDVTRRSSTVVDSQRRLDEQHHKIHNEQHLKSQNISHTRHVIDNRSITDVNRHARNQITRDDSTISRQLIDGRSTSAQDIQKQHQQQQHQETTRRDYVNAQHIDNRQSSSSHQSSKYAQHTLSSQARNNVNQSSSAEFRQAMSGQSERTHVDSTSKTSHHRKNVISSSSADVSNSVLHRRGVVSSTEALHTISSTAADQRKSISNLAETGQYISNSSQSNDRRSLTSLHRSTKDGNPWASSTYERPQRVVRQDNLTVGGKFYSQSEAKNYGNFSSQKVERVQRQSNVSHITLGDGSSTTSSMYKKEYVPRTKGPCPASLIETKQAPFKHTRDTQKHKFYMPVVSN